MADKKPLSLRKQAQLDRLHQMRGMKNNPTLVVPVATVADQPEPESEEPRGIVDAADDLIAQLGQALLQSGKSRAERNRQLSEVERVLSKLSPRDFPDLADNPVVLRFLDAMAERQAELHPQDPPGTIYNKGTLAANKKRWQWSDLRPVYDSDGKLIRGMPEITFTPIETIPVTYNGLTLMLIAEQEMTIPKCFYDIFMERRRGLETAREHAAVLFRQRGGIDPTRADPSVMGEATARVRGHGMGSEGYRPGAGMFPLGAEEGEGGETP